MPSARLPRVAYYAHHHGTGHLRHAVNIARLDAVELLVTGTAPPGGIPSLPGSAQFAALPPDVGPDGPFGPGPGSFLHYAPAAPLVRERFARLHQLWQEFTPDVVVVDVSVETALFARLCGYPVIHRRMHGERTDTPHRLAYESVNGLIAYFPESIEEPSHLAEHGGKSSYLGMLAPASAPAPGSIPVRPRTVSVQTSLGGSGVQLSDLLRAARRTPDWQWEVMGRTAGAPTDLPDNVQLLGVVSDPGPRLAASDVIVTSGGHNAVAAAAAARRPVLVIPEPRPFREQELFARALTTAGAASALTFADVPDWQHTLEQLRNGDPEQLAKTLLVPVEDFRARFLAAVEQAVSGGQYGASTRTAASSAGPGERSSRRSLPAGSQAT
ncbi:glycosyl transferase [Arthrobacter sp. zg-Y20]|uniref:glycosyltransferase n=1 Tax=unclassified Arthrobacter TaxID=235627 RepID=UPI001D13F767|nr:MULTISPECIES: glycosyltransferase [unclassified Arthrobacter]MCC3274652.1 glycosyl transferase [Arthrobacter sp. zg-Y20]MDK1314808.1 glycosyltransferase [Arthrobacter sp. zg.Y20]WIB04672.1 glycosyltransferase [Arthrobacter sp. zg-Y20]